MTHTQTTCPNRIVLRASKKGARPAEVGALAPVFEKSPMELKLKQKLLKCKRTRQIATFNVRTLNRIDQLLELTASAIDHNIDMICIQEHRYINSEDIKYHDNGMDGRLSLHLHGKLNQCHNRRYGYAYRTTSSKITRALRNYNGG